MYKTSKMIILDPAPGSGTDQAHVHLKQVRTLTVIRQFRDSQLRGRG